MARISTWLLEKLNTVIIRSDIGLEGDLMRRFILIFQLGLLAFSGPLWAETPRVVDILTRKNYAKEFREIASREARVDSCVPWAPLYFGSSANRVGDF
jgi:hypothetical protein